MRTLNLGILAHVDAGKTTLSERLLYAAGVIDEIGSVDAGAPPGKHEDRSQFVRIQEAVDDIDASRCAVQDIGVDDQQVLGAASLFGHLLDVVDERRFRVEDKCAIAPVGRVDGMPKQLLQ